MQRRRRWFAATACVLWLLGVEVLPDLHLAFHADDHTHGHDGAIHHLAAHDHDAAHAAHDHHDHDHGHGAVTPEHRWRRDRTDGPSFDHAPSVHAAAGVAHHAIALHRPPPPLLEPLPVPRAAWRLEREPEAPFHGALRARPNARGPPAMV